MARCIFVGEEFDGRIYEITKERTTIGRDPHNDLSISHSSVSREHCEIFLNGSELIIRDLGSRNGVFIDGRPLNGGQAQVRDGQTISFGRVRVRLELDFIDDPPDEVTARHQFLKYKELVHEPQRPSAIMLKSSFSDHDAGSTDEILRLPICECVPATALACPENTADGFHRVQLAWILLSLLAGLGLIGCLFEQSAAL